MSEAIFYLGLLKNYQIVNRPGTYYVRVAYTVTEDHLVLDSHPRYLVPLRAISAANLEKLISIFGDNDEVPFRFVSKYFIKGALWDDDVDEDDLPIKGEKVLATFDYVDDKLLCTHIELLPRDELNFVDINNLLVFRKTIKKLISLKDDE